MRRRRGRPTRRRCRASVGPGRGGTAGCGGEKSGCGSRRMAERGQEEPLPRELVSLAIRCFRNGTAPLPRLILRRCGPWLFRRSGGNGGAGGERREWWRVGSRREVDEWWGSAAAREGMGIRGGLGARGARASKRHVIATRARAEAVMEGAGGYRFSSNGLVLLQKDGKAGDDTCGQRRGTQWGAGGANTLQPRTTRRAVPVPPAALVPGLALSRALTRVCHRPRRRASRARRPPP